MHFMLKVKVLVIPFPSPKQTLTAILFNRDFYSKVSGIYILFILGLPIETGWLCNWFDLELLFSCSYLAVLLMTCKLTQKSKVHKN